MSTTIATIQKTQIVATPTPDASFVDLFVATKPSRRTREAYRFSITMLLAFLGKPLGEVTAPDAVAYHDALRSKYTSLHSIKLHVDIAKSLFDFGVSLNYLRTNVMKVVKTAVPSEVTHKRILTEEQALKLIDAPKRQRDKLLLRLMYAGGLRVSEVCGLQWGDVLSSGVLHVRNGKGEKDRFVTLSTPILERLNEHRQGAKEGAPIFLSQKGGRLDKTAVHRVVKRAAAAAGLSSDVSAHWLRHSHASHALDRGASIVTVRDTLGHSSIATTNKYLHSKRQDSSALYLAV